MYVIIIYVKYHFTIVELFKEMLLHKYSQLYWKNPESGLLYTGIQMERVKYLRYFSFRKKILSGKIIQGKGTIIWR